MELKSAEKIRREIIDGCVQLGFEKEPNPFETLSFLQVTQNVGVFEQQPKPNALHLLHANPKTIADYGFGVLQTKKGAISGGKD